MRSKHIVANEQNKLLIIRKSKTSAGEHDWRVHQFRQKRVSRKCSGRIIVDLPLSRAFSSSMSQEASLSDAVEAVSSSESLNDSESDSSSSSSSDVSVE